MTAPVDLTRERWLALCALAEAAVADPVRHAGDLLTAAGRLTAASPAGNDVTLSVMTGHLRWACNAWCMGRAWEREALGAGLKATAAVVRERLAPTTPRDAAGALPVPPPVPANADAVPDWTKRADIGG